MKLSEMSTQAAAACMAELVAPLSTLAKNPAVKKFMKKSQNKEADFNLFIDAVSALLPTFLRDNYGETVKVLAILTGKTAEVIDAQPALQTIADAKEVFDGDLVSFFTK